MARGGREKQVVVITGATKGLGKELSLTFAARGIEIIGLYHSDSNAAAEMEAQFENRGLHGRFIKQDITDETNWVAFDESVAVCNGKHFTLILNASAPFVPKPLHLYKWEEFSEQWDVNVKGSFLIFKRLLPVMVKYGRGTVITILSSVLNASPKGFGAYLTAKAALEGLTKAISAEYSDRGVKVFSIRPGFMETSMTSGWNPHLKARIRSRNDAPLLPNGVASRIFLLADDPNTLGRGESYTLESDDNDIA